MTQVPSELASWVFAAARSDQCVCVSLSPRWCMALPVLAADRCLTVSREVCCGRAPRRALEQPRSPLLDADTAVQHAIGGWLCGGGNPGAAEQTTKQQRGQTSIDFCHHDARWRKADQHADHRCENARHHGVVWSTDALPARACAGVCRCDRKWQARRRCERRARPCTQSMAAGDRPRVTSLRLPGKRVDTEGCVLQTLRPRAVRAHSGGARGGVCGSGYRSRVTAHQVCSRRP